MLSEEDRQRLRNELHKLSDREAALIQSKTQEKQKGVHLAWRYAHLGLEFIAVILLFLYLGNYFDGLWSTQPWLSLLGVILGFVGGLVRLIRLADRVSREK